MQPGRSTQAGFQGTGNVLFLKLEVDTKLFILLLSFTLFIYALYKFCI